MEPLGRVRDPAALHAELLDAAEEALIGVACLPETAITSPPLRAACLLVAVQYAAAAMRYRAPWACSRFGRCSPPAAAEGFRG